MIWPLVFLLAAGPQFDITDARGKKPSGITIEVGSPDEDGWMALKLGGKTKVPYTLVWPYDGRAKNLEGPGAINVLVIEQGDAKALTVPKVAVALLARELLGSSADGASVASLVLWLLTALCGAILPNV